MANISFHGSHNGALVVEDKGEILGIVHSHPTGEFIFSETDIASCNYLDVDFYLVDPDTQSIISIKPETEKN